MQRNEGGKLYRPRDQKLASHVALHFVYTLVKKKHAGLLGQPTATLSSAYKEKWCKMGR